MVGEHIGSKTVTYLRGANLISRSDANKTTYYLFNAHGDVTELLSDTGTVTHKYDYDAFGVEKKPDPLDGNPFRYCGEYYDGETKTYYLRARYYDPNIGRFTQQDTHWTTANSIYGDNPQKINEREDKLGLKTYSYAPQITAVMQSGNLYVYCGNSPTSYTDPNGSEWYHWLIGGLIVAAATAAVIITAGGAIPALYAVSAVACGTTAATTASTIAAGAFIGTSLMLSIAILDADITSIETFNNSADWATVGGAFTGGLLGGGYGYSLAHSDKLLNVRKIAGKIANAERVGTALKKNDTYHRAGSFLTEAQLSKGHAHYISQMSEGHRTQLFL